ncbi:MAG: class I SAM-dependent methyltransferase [bacterium]
MDDFYEQLAPFYHLIYDDWEAAITAQAAMLDDIIQSRWGNVRSVLDVSCGIGTQSIALAARGYEVTASDLSPANVARAQQEAEARGLQIPFSVCDMRAAHNHHGGDFDVVLSAGNSLPHLLSDDDILLALRQMHACLRPGGGCLITMRQYDKEARGRGIIKPFGVRQEGDRRYLIFQVWDFDDDHYDFAMYFVADDARSDKATTHVMRSRYYAVSPNHVLQLMAQATFQDVRRLDYGESHPAILVGTKA